VVDAFTPGPPPASGVQPAPLVTLANRVQLRLPDPPEDYLTHPAGSGVFSDTKLGPLGMGIGVVDVPVTGTEDSVALLARRCGPVSPSVAPPAGCSAERTVFDVLTGTPGVPTGVSAEALIPGVSVTWTKGSAADRTLRRFLVTATSSIHTKALLGDADVTQDYSISPDLRSALLPLDVGDWQVSVRECTDRGCGSASLPVSVHSRGVTLFDTSQLGTPPLLQQQASAPVGMFTTPAGRGARAGKTFRLQILWGVWTHWTDLRELRLRMIGERNDLGTIAVNLRSGQARVTSPGSRMRRGRLGRRGVLRARKFALRLRSARIVGSGRRGRLVSLELPLSLARSLRRQRVDVDVAASAAGGKRQGFGPAGSFQVR
jgi:hypothetical protein